MSHWLYENKTLNTIPNGHFGFVYLITNLSSGRKYIGRKYFYSTRRIKVKGSNLGLTVTEILEDGTEQVVKNNALTKGTYATGLKRIAGMTAFTTGVPIALTEGA